MPFITEEKILQVLFGYNPWWSSNQVPREFTKPVKRLAYYEVDRIFNHPTIRRSVVLSGPRRVGKTTILYQIIENQLRIIPARRILYVSFDHPMLKLTDIGQMIEVFQNNVAHDNKDLLLLFDEIQYATDWDKWLKILYDMNPSYKIMATGSASPIIHEKANESGVGRWTTLRIPTLSFFEYIELMGIEQPELPKHMKPTDLSQLKKNELSSFILLLHPLQKHFHKYLMVGGFPEVARSNDIPFAQKIIREDVVDKVLKRDIVSLFNVRNVTELEKIFLYICMDSGNIISQETIAKEVGIARQTVGNYLNLLESANLIYLSNPTELNGKKVLKSRPKIYLADAAIRNAVLMLGEEVFANPTEMGMIIETSVFKHVSSFYYDKNPAIGYYRDAKTQKEIDIVVSFPKGRLIMEVKYRENTNLSEKEAIVEWANDEKTTGAIVVTKNSEDYGVVSHNTKIPIVKIPAFAFLYLLGHAELEGYDGV